MRTRGSVSSVIPHRFIDEQSLLGFGWIGGLLLFVVLTGCAAWLLPFSIFSQACIFLHTAAGLIATAGFAAWSLSHWVGGRTLPRTARKVCAYAGFWLFAVSTLTGLVVTWQAAFGRYVGHLWHLVHLWTGVLALPLLAYHLWPSASGSELPADGAAPADRRAFRRRTWTIAGLVTGVLFVGTGGLCLYYDALQEGVFSRYQLGTSDFLPSFVNTESKKPIPVEVLKSSNSCGTADCHAVIYKEWNVSAHRWSAEDHFFQEVRTATTRVKGIPETEKCGACHDPVSMLSGHKDPKLGPNAPGHKEGDSCVVCHAIRAVDERGIGSYVLGYPKPYLFDWSGEPKGRFLNHFLIRAHPRQHNRDYNLALVRKPESCAPCHKEYDVLDEKEGPVQVETQFDDWKRGKWNTDPDAGKRLYCQQCHMSFAATSRAEADPYNLKSGFGLRHRDHSFAAANQYMPAALAVPDANAHVRRVEEWLRGERGVAEIEKVWPKGPLVELKISVEEPAQSGGEIKATVTLTNKKVGHGFPTGPLNIARAWIEFLVDDDSGRNVYHSGLLDSKNHIEDGSYVLKPLAIDTSGRMFMKADLWHPVGPQFRPAVLAGESASYAYNFKVPAGSRELVVKARLRYSKANQFFMDAVYQDTSRRPPITDLTVAEARILLRK